jgi:hypothetical protein
MQMELLGNGGKWKIQISECRLTIFDLNMNWQETINFVRQIPYGRNANREDFSLVITENKGTCSSKHAFLKDFANKNNIPNVQLIIGIYKMNEQNTNIGSLLSDNNLEYIPEAHCYLKIEGNTLDVTTNESNFEKIKADLLEEIEIEPLQVANFKIDYHQNYIRNWLIETNSKFAFDEIWKIREKCIERLSN